jgi:hypothetical protein
MDASPWAAADLALRTPSRRTSEENGMKGFRVGRHQVRVWVLNDRCRQADAWAAGVLAADRLDRPAA